MRIGKHFCLPALYCLLPFGLGLGAIGRQAEGAYLPREDPPSGAPCLPRSHCLSPSFRRNRPGGTRQSLRACGQLRSPCRRNSKRGPGLIALVLFIIQQDTRASPQSLPQLPGGAYLNRAKHPVPMRHKTWKPQFPNYPLLCQKYTSCPITEGASLS